MNRERNYGCPSPLLAAVFSFILPGTGQIYCRQDNKGIFILGFFLLGHWATAGVFSLILCPVMSLDAFQIAKKLNHSASTQRWEFFPDIKPLNRLSPRVMPLVIVILLTAIILTRIVLYASDYHPND